MLLTSPDEVRAFIGATLLEALDQPAVRAALGGLSPRLRVGLVDPDCVFVIDADEHRVATGPASDAPLSGFVAMTGETAIRYCRGQLDLERALACGEVAAAGQCAYVMRVIAANAELSDLSPALVAL